MARSLNKVMLIGNLTRDPELRYTPNGTAVCTFSVATNRQWKTESGDQKDEAEFHKVVAWDKLAEICGKMLKKGLRVFVEGRIQSRKYQTQDGAEKTSFEIVISDMLVLDSRRVEGEVAASDGAFSANEPKEEKKKGKAKENEEKSKKEKEEDNMDDIPF